MSWARKTISAAVVFIVICSVMIFIGPAASIRAESAATSAAAPQQRNFQPGGRARVSGVYKSRITPHWFSNNNRFWYRNDLAGGAKEYILVDAERGTREAAFDHAKLAAALSKATGTECQADRLPFDDISFDEAGKVVRFKVGDAAWQCDLASYQVSHIDQIEQPPAVGEVAEPRGTKNKIEEITPETIPDGTNLAHDPPLYEDKRSPDGKWTAFIKEHDVFLRGGDGAEVQLSREGVEGNSFGAISWSLDSKFVVASKIVPGVFQPVYMIQSSPPGGGRAKLRTRLYTLPGDKYTSYELWIFDAANRKGVKVDCDPLDFYGPPQPRWKQDGRHFLFQKTDRGHQRFRVFAVDVRTGKASTVLDDKAETFINTTYESFIYYTEGNEEILYASERDGWKHLYLIDANKGGFDTQVTKGQWVMRGVDGVDEEKRQIWFRASGIYPDQDPYLIHYCRVNFDGTGMVALTDGNGTHSIQYSPDRRYIVDTYSRADMAPVNELRRVSDGKLVCPLEKADIGELIAGGWTPPEVFSAKGRDGKTDIWGIIARTKDFDPAKKYPVIENIYAGPHDSYVPKSFSPRGRWSALTDLGFIVVQIDGMGTANRSKAFHDVCWHNLKDAGFPDRILWHQAVAKKYPYYDISRVGIYGVSAGGQNAAGAVLFCPEFYKVAVANSGCHDNRLDKSSWNEQWMGYPAGPWYADSSNVENAGKLQGCLMLVVGELDTNVPPENTFRLVDALIKAQKDFDLIVVPNGGHGAGGTYGQRRMQDFFLKHLQGIDPPNRNAEKG
jgi:dipeptidyl aminopeptidase/acylaminoacyl peptidase